jgi:hypothetical protein
MSYGDTTTTGARTTPKIAIRPADDPTYDVDPGKGWVLFAGIMLAIVGVLNVAFGIAAVSDSKFYVRDVAYVIGNLNLWGWFLIVIGAVQVVVAIGVWRTSETARWLGIGFAACNIIVQFFVLPAYPVWAIMVFFVDVIIIFGLLNYGGRDRHSLA